MKSSDLNTKTRCPDDADESWDDGRAGASGTGSGAKREAEPGSFRDYLRWLKDGW